MRSHARGRPGDVLRGLRVVHRSRSNGRMELMAPTDSVFLLAESREHPMHVGGLTLFEPPEGAGPGFVREFTDAMVANDEFQPTFRKRPATIMGGVAPLAWAYDDNDDIDVEYHIRRSALASPGTGPRAARANLEAAYQPAGSAPPAVGAVRGGGAERRPVRHVQQDASCTDRRYFGDEADAAHAVGRSGRRRGAGDVEPASATAPQVGRLVSVGLAGEFGEIRCGTRPIDGEAGPRGPASSIS